MEKQASEPAPWAGADVGTRFALGSAVRTGEASTAHVRLNRGSVLRLDADTVVRFARTADEAERVDFDLESGDIEIESGDQEVRFDTASGPAVVEPGTTARLGARGGGKARIDVVVGRVVIDPDSDDPRAIEAGSSFEVDLGGVVIEDDDGASETSAAPGPADAGPAAAPDGTIASTIVGDGASIETDDGWQKLPEGEGTLAENAHIRARGGTTIELRRGEQRARLSGKVDAVVGGDGGALVTARSGQVTAETGTDNLRIAVPGGSLVVRGRPGGSAAEVAVAGNGTKVSVVRGRVAVVGKDGEETVKPGERARLDERGAVKVEGQAPETAAFSLTAGETAVLHVPSPPIAIAIDFSTACDGEGIVEIAGRRGFRKPAAASAGAGRANLLLKNGSRKYRVRCLTAGDADEVVASGTVRVRRDSGERRLPRRAPHNVVDADGRRYKVLYQNQLPKLTFRWPDPARASSYQLHLARSRGKSRTIDLSSQPRHTLASGEVGEGSYRFWFTGGGKKSKETRLVIDYDNAAAAAYLEKVHELAGGGRRVEGAVLPGWTVSAGGKEIQLDRHGRFAASLQPQPGETGVAVRIAHPSRGIHYYALESR